MTDNNYGIELYHHGVKGMKWGVRRKLGDAISKHRETRRAIKEQYKAIRKDKTSFSEGEKLFWNTRKLAKNTAKRMVKKGEDFDTAKSKAKRNAFISATALTSARIALNHPKVKKFLSSSFGKAVDKARTYKERARLAFNTEILDPNGKHVKFMNTPFRDLTTALARR